jgi:hypothetical protein
MDLFRRTVTSPVRTPEFHFQMVSAVGYDPSSMLMPRKGVHFHIVTKEIQTSLY